MPPVARSFQSDQHPQNPMAENLVAEWVATKPSRSRSKGRLRSESSRKFKDRNIPYPPSPARFSDQTSNASTSDFLLQAARNQEKNESKATRKFRLDRLCLPGCVLVGFRVNGRTGLIACFMAHSFGCHQNRKPR